MDFPPTPPSFPFDPPPHFQRVELGRLQTCRKTRRYLSRSRLPIRTLPGIHLKSGKKKITFYVLVSYRKKEKKTYFEGRKRSSKQAAGRLLCHSPLQTILKASQSLKGLREENVLSPFCCTDRLFFYYDIFEGDLQKTCFPGSFKISFLVWQRRSFTQKNCVCVWGRWGTSTAAAAAPAL